jgi:hypothetical protein
VTQPQSTVLREHDSSLLLLLHRRIRHHIDAVMS